MAVTQIQVTHDITGLPAFEYIRNVNNVDVA